jgi:hypothetical protein
VKNLAGDKECDKYIKEELDRACIDVIPLDRKGYEVPASIGGRLGPFTFTRAWYYWMVEGPMPLNVAKELYAHPEGARTVRVHGHCGCPAPEAWVYWLNDNGSILWPRHKYEAELKQFSDSPVMLDSIKNMVDSGEYVVSDDLQKDGSPYVTSYHIDDQAGLLLFAMKVRDHSLHVSPMLLTMEKIMADREAQKVAKKLGKQHVK